MFRYERGTPVMVSRVCGSVGLAIAGPLEGCVVGVFGTIETDMCGCELGR